MQFDGESASSLESTEDVDDPGDPGVSTDGPEKIGAERRYEPLAPTRKLKLPNVRSISWSRSTKAGRRAGGCGRKSMVPKRIWSPPPAELLVDDEDAAEFMILASSIPTDGAN